MNESKAATDVVEGPDESKSQRDARILHLWHKLCPLGSCDLDVKGLQRGFRKIDHPLKNADYLLTKIIKEVDGNGDGKIQYEEFRSFVERAERQLFTLFRAIDKDGNGKLDMTELQAAFKSAGLTVSSRKLNDFFADMDDNNDGFISFDEWRDFLLFMPAHGHDSKLQAVLSYYNSVVNVSAEGDSNVSEETLEGLGTKSASRSLFESLFGSLFRVASPSHSLPSSRKSRPNNSAVAPVAEGEEAEMSQAAQSQSSRDVEADAAGALVDTLSSTTRQPVSQDDGIAQAQAQAQTQAQSQSQSQPQLQTNSQSQSIPPSQTQTQTPSQSQSQTQSQTQSKTQTQSQPAGDGSSDTIDPQEEPQGIKRFRLTDFAPDPGYFLAGAIAGGVSRTATAPLDRLKVYLLVNTKSGQETAASALKQGKPIAALKNSIRPFSDAVKDLYRSGGLRGFFAGNGLNVIKIMPETAIKFGSYEAAKRTLANLEGHGDAQNINAYSKFTAGGVAGMIAQFCVYPLDTLKFRLQCETVQGGATGSALVRQTAMKMFADGGFRACYRGVTMGLIGMFPYSAIDMGMFEFLKNSYRTYYAKKLGCHEDDANPGNIATGIIGATSGAIGASVVYPLNVVRTRLQTQGTVMHSATYTGIWDVTQKTIQKEGYRGLYKGLTPNLLKVAPALSITWVVYENSKVFLGLH